MRAGFAQVCGRVLQKAAARPRALAMAGLAAGLLALGGTLWTQLPAIAQTPPPAGNGTLPGMRFLDAEQLTPATAKSSYYTPAGSTVTYAWGTTKPIEITATAAALENDPQKIFAFVRNNIRYEPRMGAQKGAVGALIDRSGTAFDQAQLLVELLRAAGYTASYRVGTISLTGAQFNDWLGITSPTFARQFLANGGIPASVGGTSSITTVLMNHAWVQATIGGVTYQLDPSYKVMDRWAQVDIAADAGFSPSSFVSTAANPTGSGTENGVGYITGVNLSGAESQLNSAANTLLNKIRTDYKDKRSEEIMGGERIRRLDDPWTARTTGTLSVTLGTWTGGLPDKFRTKLKVEAGTCAVDFFVDEIYGKRLIYHSPDVWEAGPPYTVMQTGQAGFSLNGAAMPGSSPGYSAECFNTAVTGVRISVNLPYAQRAAGSSIYGSWMDRVSTKVVDFGADVVIAHGWGDTGSELQARLADDMYEADLSRASSFSGIPKMVGEYYGPPVGDFPSQSTKSKGRLYAAWLAQMSRATDILEGVSNTGIQHHYTVGVVYTQQQRQVKDANDNGQADLTEQVLAGTVADEAIRIDIDSGFSTTSKTASAADKLGARHTLAALGAMLEGSMFEQQMDAVDTASTAQRFPWAQENLASSIRFHKLLPGGGAIAQYREGVTSTYGAECSGSTTAAQDYIVVQGNDRLLGPGTKRTSPGMFNGQYPHEDRAPQSDTYMHRGCAWVAFNGDGSEIAHVVTSVDRALKGGGGPSGQDLASRSAPMQGDLLKDAFKDRSNLDGVDLRTGAYTYRPAADLTIGQGDFPYSLSFQRVFQSGGENCPKCSKGWTHNFDIRARVSGGGLEGMGGTTPRSLAGPMVAIKAAFELYKADALATQNQVAGLGVMRWLAKQFSGNVVTVNQAGAAETFVRVADGTLATAPGSQAELTQTGQRRIVDNNNYGRSAIWLYDQVSLSLKSGGGDTIAFGWKEWNPNGSQSKTTPNDFDNVMGHAQGFFATTWTFPQGVTLTFSYCTQANVIYGGEPGIPQVTSYFSACADRLTRVSSNLGMWIDVNLLDATTSDGRSTSMGAPYTSIGTVPYTDFHRTTAIGMFALTSFTDAAGKVWTYEWETPSPSNRLSPYIRLKRVKEPEKTTAQFELTYDSLGRVRTWRDGDSLAQGVGGPVYTYYAPGFGFGARKDPLDGFVRIDHDTDDRAVGQYDEMGRLTRTEYDGRGRVLARVSPFGDRTEFAYDDRNNVTEKKQLPSATVCPTGFTDPWWCQTITIKAVYHPTWNKPVQVILPATADDPNERAYDYTYNSQGLQTQVEEPLVFDGLSGFNGRPTWNFTYDSFGRPLTLTEPTGRKVTTTYGGTNPTFCRTVMIVGSQSGGPAIPTNFVCDATGNETSMTDALLRVSTTTYDALRRKTEALGPAGTNIRTQWVYDPAGRLLEERTWDATAALWRSTYKGYSIAGRNLTVTDPSGDVARVCYDAVGREAIKIDAEGRATKILFNLAGEPLTVERWWHGNPASPACTLTANLPAGQATHQWRAYSYNAAGVVTSESDAKGNATTFQYDGLGRKIVTTFPDPDGVGAMVAPTESTLTNERDQLVYIRHRSDTGDVRWSKVFADAAGRTTHLWEYTAADVLTSTTETALWPKGRVARTSYDLGGRVVWKDVSQQGASGTFSNAALRDRRAYAYDGVGWVTQDEIKPEFGTTPSLTLAYQYGYDLVGNRTSIQWPDAWTATYTYDAANRMATVSFPGGSGTWAYDSQSRPTGFSRSNGTTTSYTYEADSDLATLTHAYASGSPMTATFAYARDKAGLITYRGNTTAYDWTPSMAYARSYGPANPLNQVASEAGTALVFDVRGNMTSDGTWTFAFDQRNRMASAIKPGTTATYDYDGDDRRTKKTVNGVVTRILWSGNAELAEADSSGAILRRYVPGAAVDAPQAMVAAGGTVTWLHADGQGSIVNTSTSAGAAGTPITYSPYGEIGGSGALPSNLPFGYTGRYFDVETGLWYYRARYYHPRLGQFLQTDPIGTKDDPNLNLYVGADPVNHNDPSGMWCTASRINTDRGSVCQGSGGASSGSSIDATAHATIRNSVGSGQTISVTIAQQGSSGGVQKASLSEDILTNNRVQLVFRGILVVRLDEDRWKEIKRKHGGTRTDKGQFYAPFVADQTTFFRTVVYGALESPGMVILPNGGGMQGHLIYAPLPVGTTGAKWGQGGDGPAVGVFIAIVPTIVPGTYRVITAWPGSPLTLWGP